MIRWSQEYKDEFFPHGDSRIPDDIYAGIYHECDMEYEKYESLRGSWEDPKWMDIPCTIHRVIDTQFPNSRQHQGKHV